ncbi:MAG: response regulator transcription factor, partial [Pyrinomonadaceae bacterium]
PIFRGGLRAVIEKEPGFNVIAEAGDGATALTLARGQRPDVVLLDLDMPVLDGFAVAAELRAAEPPIAVVILTMHKDEMHVNRAVDLGVRGFLLKDGVAAEVVGCIRTVVAGGEFFSPVLSSHLLNRARRSATFSTQAGVADLTRSERRVLCLLAQLKTSKEIAAELGVSPRTIENHRAHICAKLELSGSHALTKFAIQHKNELA